jgi:predicted ATP-grasp superfamily ATP-dependent carboligase
MAQSAVAAGFRVSSIDAFGDLDHPRSAGVSTPGNGPHAVWRSSRLPRLAAVAAPDANAIAYGSALENDARAVAALACGRMLWGNAPRTLQRVRDARLLCEAFRARGHDAPEVRMPGEARPLDPQNAWLLKPRRSGGGVGVRRWRRGTRVPAACYAQHYVDGTAGSVLFVAARGHVAPLGVTRQLVGDPAFGASGFRYCGSVLCGAGDDDARLWSDSAIALARTAGAAFALVGVGGVDFIARDGVVHPIEVNPRWTSSMELVERAWARSVFGVHAAACIDGSLPAGEAGGFVTNPARAYGKAIVFARRDVRLGDTRLWLGTGVADIPQPWTQIAAGRPVCTVLAEGADVAACRASLVARAQAVYRQLDEWAQCPGANGR